MKKTLKNADLSLISQLVFSIILIIIGVLGMIYKAFGIYDMILYVSVLFYVVACLSMIAYFVKRREGDYELLFLSLISAITATFMFVFKTDSIPMILGAGMCVFGILELINRIYKIYILKNEENFMWSIKTIITFSLVLLTIITTINFYKEITVQTMMIAYFFIMFGFLLTCENLVELFLTNRKFQEILSKMLDEDPYKNLDSIKEERIKKIEEEKSKEKKKRTVKSKTLNSKVKSNSKKDVKKKEKNITNK